MQRNRGRETSPNYEETRHSDVIGDLTCFISGVPRKRDITGRKRKQQTHRLLSLAQRAGGIYQQMQLSGLQIYYSSMLQRARKMRRSWKPVASPSVLYCKWSHIQTNIPNSLGATDQTGRISNAKRSPLVRTGLDV